MTADIPPRRPGAPRTGAPTGARWRYPGIARPRPGPWTTGRSPGCTGIRHRGPGVRPPAGRRGLGWPGTGDTFPWTGFAGTRPRAPNARAGYGPAPVCADALTRADAYNPVRSGGRPRPDRRAPRYVPGVLRGRIRRGAAGRARPGAPGRGRRAEAPGAWGTTGRVIPRNPRTRTKCQAGFRFWYPAWDRRPPAMPWRNHPPLVPPPSPPTPVTDTVTTRTSTLTPESFYEPCRPTDPAGALSHPRSPARDRRIRVRALSPCRTTPSP